MAKKKVNKVSAMRIDEVSLVDLPANAGSTVVLMKRGTPAPDGGDPGNSMEYDDMPQTLNELSKALADAKDENDDLKKRLEEATEAISKLEKAAKANDGNEGDGSDAVLKSLPQPMRKQWEEMQKSNKELQDKLAKQEEDREMQSWIRKTAALGNIAGQPGELGALLRRVEKGLTTAEDAETIMKTLTSANAMAAAMTREQGTSVAKAGSAEDRLYQRAAERVEKSGGSLTKAQAVDQILKEDKTLYTEYMAEQSAA